MKHVRFRDEASDKSVIINPALHRLSATQPNDCDEVWDGLKRWKASVGSASWRNFRRSRRMILRCESKRQLPSDSLDKQSILNRSQHMLIDLGADEDGSTASETESANSLENDSDLESIDLPENSCSNFRKEDCKSNADEVNDDSSQTIEPERTNTNNSCSEESILLSRIALYEGNLNEQETEINDLEVELEKMYKENDELGEKLSRKRQEYFALDDKYTVLKVEVADARADEDDLNYELTEMVTLRDNQTMQLNNEINEMRARIERMEIENKYYIKKLERAQSVTQQKDSRLLNTLERVDFIKSQRSLLVE